MDANMILKDQVHRLRRIALLLLLVPLCLCACQSDLPIAEDRTQTQALQIVSLLNKQGIAAYATKNRSGGRFSVTVPARYYHQGVTLVDEYELAGEARLEIAELVESRGLLPGSRESERFRLDLALAMQLEDSLENIDGVVSARAIVRKHAVSSEQQPGGLVTVLVREGATVSRKQVLPLVKAALPDLSEKSIFLEVSEFSPERAEYSVAGAVRSKQGVLTVPLRKFLFWQVPEGDHGGLVIAFLVGILITAVLFLCIGYLVGYIRTVRPTVDESNSVENDMLGYSMDRDRNNLPEV